MEDDGTVNDEMLLRLLVRSPALDTADAWDGVLQRQNETGKNEAPAESASASASRDGLLSWIGRILPHLPEYSTVGPSLKALMLHCQSRYPTETSAVIRGWLHEGTRLPPRFRQWLLCDWLGQCSHLHQPHQDAHDPDEDRERLLWHEALLVMAVNETQQPLKRVLLLLLDGVRAFSRSSELQGERGDEANEEQAITSDTAANAAFGPVDTVTGLLDFYWSHAEELGRFVMLCAAKLRRVFVERVLTGPLEDQEEVGVRMRWYLLTKPVLFEPLLRHGLALGVFAVQPDSPSSYHHVVPSDDMRLAAAMTLQSEDIIHRLDETVGRLRAARDTRVIHLLPDGFQHLILLTYTSNGLAELRSLLPTDKTRLLEEFDRDLDEASTHLFPRVLLAFATFIKTCCSSFEDIDFDKTAVGVLFDLFERRAGDESGGRSCLQVLAVVLDLRVAGLRVWRDSPQLYVDVCETLYANATLQAGLSASMQWAAQMALQQLLLECDVSVLETSLAALSVILPDRILRLARLRMRRSIKE